jgi:hypothetical protein
MGRDIAMEPAATELGSKSSAPIMIGFLAGLGRGRFLYIDGQRAPRLAPMSVLQPQSAIGHNGATITA